MKFDTRQSNSAQPKGRFLHGISTSSIMYRFLTMHALVNRRSYIDTRITAVSGKIGFAARHETGVIYGVYFRKDINNGWIHTNDISKEQNARCYTIFNPQSRTVIVLPQTKQVCILQGNVSTPIL